jgi:general secretion pathway protein G
MIRRRWAAGCQETIPMSKKQLKRSPRRGGFTLIELLLVLVILAVLAAIVVQNFGGTQEMANTKATKAAMSSLDGAIETFKIHTGRYPTTEEGLGALLSAPGDVKDWNGPYLKPAVMPKDGWGHEFIYRVGSGSHNANSFDLYSAGKDGQPETEDDINNWSGQ